LDFPEDLRPPVLPTFLSFRIMVVLGFLLLVLSFYAWKARKKLEQTPKILKILPWAIPLPYIAMEAGWIVAEVGRQPWIVYGMLKTADAVSRVSGPQVYFSFWMLTILYTFLGAVDIYLLFKYAKKGPEKPKMA